ncbi:putative dinucleotide-binding enzyme [Bradyrhizobium sp. USDA 3315]
MRIGIVGPGRMGVALGKFWALAGHEVILAGARDPERSRAAARWIGNSACAVASSEIAGLCDVLLVTVPWWGITDVLRSVGDLSGKLVIDAINPYAPGYVGRDTGLAASTSVAETMAGWLPKARIVKAFSTIPDIALTQELRRRGIAEVPGLRQPDGNTLPETAPGSGEWPCLIAGDDNEAIAIVERLAQDIGFIPVRAGGLKRALIFELGGPLYGLRLRADALREQLKLAEPY